jgi:Origin of replication binding protein
MSYIDIRPPVGYVLGFQDTVDFNKAKYCFKYEYGDNGKRCLLAGEDKQVFLTWMSGLPEDQKRFYELIRETDKVAEFYDIDLQVNNKTLEYMNETSVEIVKNLLHWRNEAANGYNATISQKDIIVLSAHTSTKLSLHIISKRTYFENNQLHGLFAKDLYALLDNVACGFNIDTSVYSKNRCFRMFRSHKYKKTNPLVLFEPSRYNYATMNDTLVVVDDPGHREMIVKYDANDIIVHQNHDPGEVLSGSLEDKLKAFLRLHPYLELSDKNRLNRVEHTTRPCLTDPTDAHSTENMFWHIHNNSMYVSCFCMKGKPICLGQREGITKIDIAPEPFYNATHTSDDFKDYSELGSFTTLMDKRRTGKGKTTCAMKYASQMDRVLLVHHRLTLDDDYINKYPEFVSYQQNTTGRKQTVCYNSLHKIDITKYDLIVIDEIRSILKQSEMKNMLLATHSLFNILENTRIPLIMLDANMTSKDFDFIMSFRKDASPLVIHDPYNVTDKEVFVYIGTQSSDNVNMLTKIRQQIERDEKVIIIYNRSIESINAFLAPFSETHRVLHINRLTRSSVSMRSETWFDEYDIIAYSPTISEGVSINDPRFSTVKAYGLFVSTSSPAESVSQMVARFRAVKTFEIHVDVQMKKAGTPVFRTLNDVYEHVKTNVDFLNCNVERRDGELRIIQDEFFQLYSKNALESSLDYHNYSQTVIQKLINNGYQVYYASFDVPTLEDMDYVDVDLPRQQTEENDRICKGIVEAQLLTAQEVDEIKDNIQSEADSFKVIKFNLLSTLNLAPDALTIKIVDAYRKNYETQRLIRNLRHCFVFTRGFVGGVERIPMDQILNTNLATSVSIIENRKTFGEQKQPVVKFTLARSLWLNKTAKDLGFQSLLALDPISKDVFYKALDAIVAKHAPHTASFRKLCTLFGKSFSSRTKVNRKYILGLFKTTIGVVFKEKNDQVRQFIGVPVMFCDPKQQVPSLLSSSILPDETVRQYAHMFHKRCPLCNDIVPDIEEHMVKVNHEVNHEVNHQALAIEPRNEEPEDVRTEGEPEEPKEVRNEPRTEEARNVRNEPRNEEPRSDEPEVQPRIVEEDDLYDENEYHRSEDRSDNGRDDDIDDIYDEDEMDAYGEAYGDAYGDAYGGDGFDDGYE